MFSVHQDRRLAWRTGQDRNQLARHKILAGSRFPPMQIDGTGSRNHPTRHRSSKPNQAPTKKIVKTPIINYRAHAHPANRASLNNIALAVVFAKRQ